MRGREVTDMRARFYPGSRTGRGALYARPREGCMPARKKTGARTPKRGVTWATVRKLALSFPGMTEGTSYGEPAFLLDGKFFSRFNPKEQGLVVYAAEPLRDALLAGRADTYFTSDHYRSYPYVLARLEQLPRAELESLFEEAFRAKAKRKRVMEYDAARSDRTSPRRGPATKRRSRRRL